MRSGRVICGRALDHLTAALGLARGVELEYNYGQSGKPKKPRASCAPG